MALSPMRGLAYTLRNTLYVSLTNEVNSVSLIGSRGPAFKMPESSGFVKLDNGIEPTSEDVFSAGESYPSCTSQLQQAMEYTLQVGIAGIRASVFGNAFVVRSHMWKQCYEQM